MKTLKEDNDAQMAGKAITLVVTLTIAAILSAFLLPVAIDQLNADSEVTITQDTNTTEEVNAKLNATLDSVDDTAGTATYTLNQTDGNSVTKTVDEGSNATFAMDRGDVVVNVSTVNTGNATATFSYASDFSYSSGASSLWNVLGLLIVLASFLFMIGYVRSNTRM